MHKRKYESSWSVYLANGSIPYPKGWGTFHERDEFARGCLVGCKKCGYAPEVAAIKLGIARAHDKSSWPAWFYRMYMQVYPKEV